ncbi:MAG: hypothetical protein HY726_00640 [Candidatus Rokubacteria bacterium]|nr:hypothetical protein [Candidatus Rokubacteria bacterium]
MKVLFRSLAAMLAELREGKLEAVRVAPLIRTESGRSTGIPYYTSRIVVTARTDPRCWDEWRLLVGRGMGEVTESGLTLPAALRQRGTERLAEVKRRIEGAGFRVLDGMVTHEADAVDGVLECSSG